MKAIVKNARDFIAKHAPPPSASPNQILEAIKTLNNSIKQGSFKPGSPGYIIIENELKQLEQDLIETNEQLSSTLKRKLNQINALINSGKFDEANKMLADIPEKDREIINSEYQESRNLFNQELNSKVDQLIDRIKRSDNSGEISNIIKEAKIKQVYNFRRKIIEDAAQERSAYVNKMQAQIQKKNAAAQKREDRETWKHMIEDLERHRGTHGFDAFIATADEAAKRLHDDKLVAAAKSYADIGRTAKSIDNVLHQFLDKQKPSFLLKDGNRTQNVRCIALDKNQYVILIRNPSQTINHKRDQTSVPVVSFLNAALSNRNVSQRNQLISVYMSFWKHPYAGQYRIPFPKLSNEYPFGEYPQLETKSIEMPYSKNQFEVDFTNPGMWQAQFQGKSFQFKDKKLSWSIYGGLGGNVAKDPESKLNFQTLAFAPKVSPSAEIDLKLRLHEQSFLMVGLRRANKYVRVVLNSNDDALGAVLTAPDGKMDIRPKNDAIVDEDVFDDDIRLRITIDKDNEIIFEINGKELSNYDNGIGELKLPGSGDVQLVLQGFKISANNGTVEILDLEVKQNR